MDSYSAILSTLRLVAGRRLRRVRGLELRHAAPGPSPASATARRPAFPNSVVTSGDHLPVRRLRHDEPTCRPSRSTSPASRPARPGSCASSSTAPTRSMMGLVAVIRKTDGTGVLETIPLNPANQSADYLLSVPLAQLSSVGLVISNTSHHRQQRGLEPHGQQAAAGPDVADQSRERRQDPRAGRHRHRDGHAHEHRRGRIHPGLRRLRHGPGAGAQVGAAGPRRRRRRPRPLRSCARPN